MSIPARNQPSYVNKSGELSGSYFSRYDHSPQANASRRKLAEIRQAERGRRSDQEQLALIAKRPGKSAREKARLEARIKAAAEQAAPKVEVKGKKGKAK